MEWNNFDIYIYFVNKKPAEILKTSLFNQTHAYSAVDFLSDLHIVGVC